MLPRRILALVLLVLHLGACQSWQLTTVSPPQVTAQERRVRITRIDGERVTVQDPEVRGDSIFGGDRSVAVSDIQLIEVQRFSVGRTIGLVVVTPVVYVALWVVACTISDCGN